MRTKTQALKKRIILENRKIIESYFDLGFRFQEFCEEFMAFLCLSLLTSDNVIAAAAKAASVHSAVSSAITQVAVTAVAIASGACLSTKFDFLWPKLQEQSGLFCLSILFIY